MEMAFFGLALGADIDGKVFFTPLKGKAPQAGAFVKVRIEDSDDHDLFGRQAG